MVGRQNKGWDSSIVSCSLVGQGMVGRQNHEDNTYQFCEV